MNSFDEKDNDELNFIGVLFVAYLVLSALPFFGGMVQARDPELCQSKWSRIEYVFPAYRVGCWLNSPPTKEGEE
jgi:hypothetical protein